MSPILERAVAPIIVTMIWIMAILMILRQDASGTAPMIAGLVGGVALILQALLGGEREIRRVFALRAPATAGLALLAFLAGAALAIFLGTANAVPITVVGGVPVTVGLLATILIHLGIALSLAAILAEAALRLLEEVSP